MSETEAGADVGKSATRVKYWTADEVAAHSTESDLWVSYLGKVYDLSKLAQLNAESALLEPITAAAGTDISHWFDPATGDVRMHIDPVTGCRVPHTPFGRFLHIAPPVPRTDWDNSFGRPWWKDASYCVGNLTKFKRTLRVVNMLTSQETLIDVCCEETIREIQERYRKHNAHTSSYTWKYHGHILDMGKTLDENGVHNEFEKFQALSIDTTAEASITEVQVYYNDDLTEG